MDHGYFARERERAAQIHKLLDQTKKHGVTHQALVDDLTETEQSPGNKVLAARGQFGKSAHQYPHEACAVTMVTKVQGYLVPNHLQRLKQDIKSIN